MCFLYFDSNGFKFYMLTCTCNNYTIIFNKTLNSLTCYFKLIIKLLIYYLIFNRNLMTNKEEENECLRIINKKDYYEILELEKNATDEQIKKAYRRLAVKFHPDKNKSKNAEEAFKKINQAFTVLSDKNKRKNYDLFGSEEGQGLNGMNFSTATGADFDPFEIFNAFFQGSGFSNGFGPEVSFTSFGNGGTTFKVYSSGFNDFGFHGFPFHQNFAHNNINRTNNQRRRNQEEINIINLTTLCMYIPILILFFMLMTSMFSNLF